MNARCLAALAAVFFLQSLVLADPPGPELAAIPPATLPATEPADLGVDVPAGPAFVHAPAVGPAVIIPFSGEVTDESRDALFVRFANARTMGAKTVILEISTFGGSLPAGLEISNFLKQQRDIHIIAFVKDKAISAGAMMACACDEIVMAPYASLGDCAPIIFTPESKVEPLGLGERAKEEAPVLREFDESARRNGYNRLLLESMVRVQTTVYYVQDEQGHKRFVNEEGYKQLIATGKWKSVPGVACPVDGPTTLLTVHTDEALLLGLARETADSADDLAAKRGLTVIANLAPTIGDALMDFLGNQTVRFILVMIFLQALYMGFSAPGDGAAEAIAAISLGLLVGVPLLSGYVQWWDLLLIFGGLALVAFEIFVFPGHMVSAIVGSIMVLIGLLLTFVRRSVTTPGSWHSHATWTDLTQGVEVIAGALVASVVCSTLLRRFLPSIPYLNRLILPTLAGAGTAAPSPIRGLEAETTTDRWPFVGTIGRAVSDLKPGGTAEFPYGDDTKTASVNCSNGYVIAGEKVVVREVVGSLVVVNKVAPAVARGGDAPGSV